MAADIDVDRFSRTVRGKQQFMLRCRACGWESGVFLDDEQCASAAGTHAKNTHGAPAEPPRIWIDACRRTWTLDEAREADRQ